MTPPGTTNHGTGVFGVTLDTKDYDTTTASISGTSPDVKNEAVDSGVVLFHGLFVAFSVILMML